MIDFRDLAAVATKCATDSSHAGKLYNLPGPELISPYDIAERIGRATGQPVKYYDMEPDEFRRLLMSLATTPITSDAPLKHRHSGVRDCALGWAERSSCSSCCATCGSRGSTAGSARTSRPRLS